MSRTFVPPRSSRVIMGNKASKPARQFAQTLSKESKEATASATSATNAVKSQRDKSKESIGWSKDDAILRDGRDPQLAANLRTVGQVIVGEKEYVGKESPMQERARKAKPSSIRILEKRQANQDLETASFDPLEPNRSTTPQGRINATTLRQLLDDKKVTGQDDSGPLDPETWATLKRFINTATAKESADGQQEAIWVDDLKAHRQRQAKPS